jgi:hypothetical protein
MDPSSVGGSNRSIRESPKAEPYWRKRKPVKIAFLLGVCLQHQGKLFDLFAPSSNDWLCFCILYFELPSVGVMCLYVAVIYEKSPFFYFSCDSRRLQWS